MIIIVSFGTNVISIEYFKTFVLQWFYYLTLSSNDLKWLKNDIIMNNTLNTWKDNLENKSVGNEYCFLECDVLTWTMLVIRGIFTMSLYIILWEPTKKEINY